MPHPSASHADHDPLAIAAYAAGDATGPELDAAHALVAGCPDCAALHHDLRAIATALPALPVPVRSRDFRLTPEQAASLRPRGWRRLLVPLAGPRFAFAGPLGTGLATLGIAGLLAAGSVGMPLGGAASAPVREGSPEAAAPGVERASPELAPLALPRDLAGAQTMDPVDQPASQGGGRFGALDPDPSFLVGDGETYITAPGASGDPKVAPLPGTAGAATTPEDDTFVQASEAPAPGPPVVSPVAGVAGTLLFAGLLMAALRAVARRAA
jgi:hypothetical protein